MPQSSLATISIPSPNRYSPRAYRITRVTVHHMAGALTAEQCGHVFQPSSRQASSNYGVDGQGRIACYVDESDAAWTSSSWENDNRAITIEVANTPEGVRNGTWEVSQEAWDALVTLCADICKRYGIVPTYTGDTRGSFTEHRMFAPTSCPGPYLHEHMGRLCEEVSRAMQPEPEPEPEEVPEVVTKEDMEQIAELCALKVAEGMYWPEDKKAQWGPEGKGKGGYYRNNYNALRLVHDLLVSVNYKIDRIAKKLGA